MISQITTHIYIRVTTDQVWNMKLDRRRINKMESLPFQKSFMNTAEIKGTNQVWWSSTPLIRMKEFRPGHRWNRYFLIRERMELNRLKQERGRVLAWWPYFRNQNAQTKCFSNYLKRERASSTKLMFIYKDRMKEKHFDLPTLITKRLFLSKSGMINFEQVIMDNFRTKIINHHEIEERLHQDTSR